MTDTWLWVQHHNGRWHAWSKERQVTACGMLNAENLRLRPPRAILTGNLPQEHWAACCSHCQNSPVHSTRPDPRDDAEHHAQQWVGFINLHARTQKARIARKHVDTLAVLLASFGSPQQEAAKEAWRLLRIVLLTATTVKKPTRRVQVFRGLGRALKLIPPNSPALTQVLSATRAWTKVMGAASVGPIDSERVIKGMLEVPSPDLYLEHLRRQGFTTLSSVFSSGVLERAKKAPELRGMWNKSGDYWESTRDQLRVIE